jgi:hypothetical protein
LPACAMRMNFWGAAARLLRPISFHFCRPCSGGVAGRVLGMGCRGIVWGALVGGGVVVMGVVVVGGGGYPWQKSRGHAWRREWHLGERREGG